MAQFNRFGTDIMMTEDGDIIFNADGDMMTTQDYENQLDNVVFYGHYSILRAISNRLITNPGEYPFDPAYGGAIESQLSKPIDANFIDNISLLVSNELKKDPRVEQVIGVTTRLVQSKMVLISAQVKLIGDDSVSSFVFPRMFIPN